MMNEKPILFSGEMVRAILAGRKSQTRRVVKECFESGGGVFWTGKNFTYEITPGPAGLRASPYGTAGDRLWVKETHIPAKSGVIYRTDLSPMDAAGTGALYGGWKPSIFMRREYSRLTLEIVSVRVERLNEISGADAMAEGLDIPPSVKEAMRYQGGEYDTIDWQPEDDYRRLWESINGAGSWAKNPWVWVIGFRRVSP